MSNKEIIEQEVYYNDNILNIMYSIIKQCARFWDTHSEYDNPDITEFLYTICNDSLNSEKFVLQFLANITDTFITEASKNAYDYFINFIQSHLTVSVKAKNNLIKIINIVLENNRDFIFTDTLTENQITELKAKYKRTIKLRFEDSDEQYKVSYKWTDDY